MIDKLENGIFIHCTKEEYSYLKELSNSMYNTLKKLPKNMRTPKFYILESMINNIFTE